MTLLDDLLSVSQKSAEVQSAPFRQLSKLILYDPESKRPFPRSPYWGLKEISKLPQGSTERREKEIALLGNLMMAGLTTAPTFRTGLPQAKHLISPREREAVRALEKGTSAEDLIGRGFSPGDIQNANQRIQGLGILSDLDNAVKAKDFKLVEKIANRIMVYLINGNYLYSLFCYDVLFLFI